MLHLMGFATPEFKYFAKDQASMIKNYIQPNKRYVLKANIPGCVHKTEIGAVNLDLTL